ncbi:MAG: peptidoglycan D,D-transpeptidase FtsI family protein, partial [Gemmatimonadota bacterium]
MKPRVHRRRRRLLLAVLVLCASTVAARAMRLQVMEHERWASRAEDQHRQRMDLPAPRGVIYDRNGVPLASSREAFRVAVAPHEVTDRAAVERLLRDVLGLSASAAVRALDRSDPWVVLAGRYGAEVHERLAGVPGIHFDRVLERFYPHGDLALELIGRVDTEGRPLSGIELELDSVLAGRPGTAVVRRDATGRPIPGVMLTVAAPRAGDDVYLTIDHNLQEIASEALGRAIEETEAEGGDLLLIDPQTGELLAAVSERLDGRRQWWAAMEPFEPGSTIKPFTAAALLAEGRVTAGDSVFAERGRWRQGGRVIQDVAAHEWLTLGDAVRVSSNIAMAKLAERITPGEQYRYLRDFGFGTPTGVRYPSESAGLLRRPAEWSAYSQASLAYGYEVAVTPLQLAMAYGALANGGVLMAPRLIRAIETRDGRIARSFAPRPLRRVIRTGTAGTIRRTLVDAVEEGTGALAALGGFRVAGKTGTTRRVGESGYGDGGHTASFAGFFPAYSPQLAFLVKLDRPRGSYTGGLAAAPVVRNLLEAALAARSIPLDRRTVATVLEPAAEPLHTADVGAPLRPMLAALDGRPRRGDEPAGPVVLDLDGGASGSARAASSISSSVM